MTKGNILKQGDKTLLKYLLFDADGDSLNIVGKSAKVRLMYPNFMTVGYEKDGLTVTTGNEVHFTIDQVIPSRIYHLEIIVDDTHVFPSRADEAKFTIDKSSLGAETNIIEIIGKDILIRDVRQQVETGLQPMINSIETSESERIEAESEREQNEAQREANETNRISAEQNRVLAETGREAKLNAKADKTYLIDLLTIFSRTLSSTYSGIEWDKSSNPSMKRIDTVSDLVVELNIASE